MSTIRSLSLPSAARSSKRTVVVVNTAGAITVAVQASTTPMLPQPDENAIA